jgi:hypothetical protein
MAQQALDEHGPGDPGGRATAFELSSAALRSEHGALDATLHGLVARLSGVPGLNVAVTRRRPWWRRVLGDLPYLEDRALRKGPIETVTVSTGRRRYELVRAGASIRSTREQQGDPPQELDFTRWAGSLLADIEAENQTSHDSLRALRAFVEHEQAA